MAATLKLDTITNASNATGNNNIELDAYSNVKINGATLSPAASASNTGNLALTGSLVMGSSFKRNKIINGDMRVDQRNAGASVTQTGSALYSVDRFAISGSVTSKFSAQQSSVAPAGFVNSVLCASLSAYTVGTGEFFSITQRIEGLNISDWNWGTANAKTVTLSFWVRSSLTGTFGGALYSYSGDASYPFSYTISLANTWTAISITIAGPTIGTFPTDNSGSLVVNFSLGANSSVSGTAGSWSSTLYRSTTGATSVVGTNGATFYITGVQLEVGSVATPYERQIYSDQLAQCQRYFYKSNPDNRQSNGGIFGAYYTATDASINGLWPVIMRTTPSSVTRGGTSDTFYISNVSGTGTGNFQNTVLSANGIWTEVTSLGASAKGQPITYNGQLSVTAEL